MVSATEDRGTGKTQLVHRLLEPDASLHRVGIVQEGDVERSIKYFDDDVHCTADNSHHTERTTVPFSAA